MHVGLLGRLVVVADAGEVRVAAGPARRVPQQAVTILEELRYADAERVRGKVAALGPTIRT